MDERDLPDCSVKHVAHKVVTNGTIPLICRFRVLWCVGGAQSVVLTGIDEDRN